MGCSPKKEVLENRESSYFGKASCLNSLSQPHVEQSIVLHLEKSPEGLSACGGFLVQEDFVLTAGHCLGSSISVTLGTHNIHGREKTQQHITVLRAIRHPDYNPQTIRNDIMLLQGDSGGPLVCCNEAQGIISYGSNNGNPPAVFTKIQSFMPWIKRTMRHLAP
ncbi:cathepsin G-like [Grammomys surdaster]|uniref:cathepsin G-like n=1 Tax=Grammomys surdaster TaxID=491861 RepID=UPI00109F4BDA|nr:cathepsin G-like [Grammomys surdaster]